MAGDLPTTCPCSSMAEGKRSTTTTRTTASRCRSEETPVYLEWTLWRAALAMGALTNHPSEVMRFPSGLRFPAGFHSRRRTRRPVLGNTRGLHHSDRGHHVSRSSRQEAMAGRARPAPCIRRRAEIRRKEHSRVYGLFVAIKIDTNTAETFRHGIWYTKDDAKQRLDILPLPLEQFQSFFVSLFQSNEPAKPQEGKAANRKLRSGSRQDASTRMEAIHS